LVRSVDRSSTAFPGPLPPPRGGREGPPITRRSARKQTAHITRRRRKRLPDTQLGE
jgi:hypothetical protein